MKKLAFVCAIQIERHRRQFDHQLINIASNLSNHFCCDGSFDDNNQHNLTI